MQSLQPKPFGKLRNFLWPIYGHELKKLLPMLALFFLITFVYNVLRCMKITLVVTSEGSGAEAIPFLKVWAVLPGAILITYVYTKLTHFLNREQVFYTMLSFFLGFFTLFLLVLYPNREILELTTLANSLQAWLPEGLSGLISIIRHWPLTIFYVLSELWSTAVLSMLFWGFANEVTSVHEAKRFYSIFALAANFSAIFSGQSGQFLTLDEYKPYLPFGTVAWEQSLTLQLGVVLLIGVAIVVLFRWVNKTIAKQKKTMNFAEANAIEEPPQKFSLLECFSYLVKSRYMLFITILVVAYNIVFNFADVLWIAQVKLRYPDASDFNAFTNQIATITGILATLSALLLSGNVIRRYGWTITAMITPVIWLVTSIGFFGCLLYENNFYLSDLLYALFHLPIANLVLIFGATQICLGRASKYSVFDETKEIAFVPLSRAEQRKGKAIVDGIASRLGKSGGSISFQCLLFQCGNLAATIPYVAMIFLVVITLWIIAVRGLGKMVKHSIDQSIDPVTSTPISLSESVYKNS